MSTGLIVPNDTGISVINPDSGEVHRLEDCPSPVIARVLGFVQRAIDSNLEALYEAKRALGGELVERMDRQGEWTVSARGVKVSAPSPTAGTVSWDAEMLDSILEDLVNAGTLDAEARLRAVKREYTLTVDKRGVAALQKIPAVAEAINVARSSNPPGYRKASVRIDPREF